MTDDPSKAAPKPDPSRQDGDWGDVVEPVDGDAVNPVLRLEPRLPRAGSAMSRSGGGDPSIEDEDASGGEDGDQQGAGRVKVREIDGARAGRVRPERPELPASSSSGESHAKAMYERLDIEGKEWSKRQTFSVKWMVGIVSGVILLILVCLALLPWINRDHDDSSSGVAVPGPRQIERQEKDRVIEDLLLRNEEAISVFSKYATANVVDDVLPILRGSAKVEPLLRASDFKAMAPYGWRPAAADVGWTLSMIGRTPFGILSGQLPGYRKYEAYFVLSGDQLRLDWKATMGYGTASFAQLLNGVGDGGEIRGVMEPAVFYTMAYPEADYQCYQLVSPDGEQIIWCYAKQDQPVAMKVARVFLGGGIVQHEIRPTKVTLKLVRGSADSLKNQWLIDDLLHEHWIAP